MGWGAPPPRAAAAGCRQTCDAARPHASRYDTLQGYGNTSLGWIGDDGTSGGQCGGCNDAQAKQLFIARQVKGVNYLFTAFSSPSTAVSLPVLDLPLPVHCLYLTLHRLPLLFIARQVKAAAPDLPIWGGEHDPAQLAPSLWW